VDFSTPPITLYLEHTQYDDPEEALVQYIGKRELFAAVRASMLYLSDAQLLDQISQRLTAEEFDTLMLTTPGKTYRDQAEHIAFNLTFTPGPVTSQLSVPKLHEVLNAFLRAKPFYTEVRPAFYEFINKVTALGKQIQALKNETFNSEL
ncbi:unnamed protein product, partial [Auanema sp. JU1783]